LTTTHWEQGKAKPNAQAAALIKLVEKYPDMVERLEAL
jgi:putative transcriptional regulator